MDSVIEQLQAQNGDQYRRLGELEKICARVYGNGDDTGTIAGRLREVENGMKDIKEYIAEQRTTRDVLTAMEQKNNKRLVMAISVMGLMFTGASVAIGLLT